MRRIVVALLAVTAMSIAANAADMPVKGPVYKAPPPALYDWSGLYVGVNGGYIWGHATQTDIDGYNDAGSTIGYRPNGFQGGGHIGYNYQINQFVLGVEGEVGYLAWKKSAQYGPYIGVRSANDSIASTSDGAYGVIAGRIGVAFNNFLVFAKGGGIFTGVKNSFTDTDPFGTTLVSGTDTSDRNGWTVGGGVEYAYDRNWVARFEYAHYDFGTETETATSAGGTTYRFDHKLTADSVRVGISYFFR